MKVNMHEAKSQLSRLARLAWQGEEIVICKSGRPWLRLIPYREQLERRRPGGLEGQIRIRPDFDAEDEEIIAAFENFELFPGGE
jgi:prevent-host-death family protein